MTPPNDLHCRPRLPIPRLDAPTSSRTYAALYQSAVDLAVRQPAVRLPRHAPLNHATDPDGHFSIRSGTKWIRPTSLVIRSGMKSPTNNSSSTLTSNGGWVCMNRRDGVQEKARPLSSSTQLKLRRSPTSFFTDWTLTFTPVPSAKKPGSQLPAGGGSSGPIGEAQPAQCTSTSTAAFSADLPMSSNLHSLVLGSLSLADTSGTDSRKLSRKLLLTA